MKTWLLRVVEGRYRSWDDFVDYGMASAGHDTPPSAPLKLLSPHDEVYAFLDNRGYVGRGKVIERAVLADQFVVHGDFVAKDGSGRFDRVKLPEIQLLRADMCEGARDPLRGEWVVRIQWLSTCPRNKARCFPAMPVPKDTVEVLVDAEAEKLLSSAFNS
jgi:hypothetical protein